MVEEVYKEKKISGESLSDLRSGITIYFTIERIMKLDILHYVQQLKIRANDQSDQVWDGIRKQWVAFTPEEMVRQLFIQYLIHEKNIARIHSCRETNRLIKIEAMRYHYL